jgi:hypothetical protein
MLLKAAPRCLMHLNVLLKAFFPSEPGRALQTPRLHAAKGPQRLRVGDTLTVFARPSYGS